ncbi:hypothetical protein HDU78_005800 [Chytriomyces hyalinus]|nr:hypothetical protein HDU78_005800 [Chytriomyces hyalinus]
MDNDQTDLRFAASDAGDHTGLDIAIGGSVTLASTIEEAIGRALDSRLNALVARLAPIPSQKDSNSAVLAAKVDLMLGKLNAIDSRITAVEASLGNGSKRAVAGNPIDAYSQGVQQATAEVMQEQVADLTSGVAKLMALNEKTEAVLADSIDNLVWFLDQAAKRQTQPTSSALPSPVDSEADLKMDRIGDAIRAMNARMESVEKMSTTVIPDMVSKGLAQISIKQKELDDEVRASLTGLSALGVGSQDAELLSKLHDLETKIETMPQMYIDTVALSFQKQTTSLLSVMDDIVKEQTEAITQTKAAVSNKRSSTVRTAITAVPSIPDMGIASRLSKLTSLALNRRSNPPGEKPVGKQASRLSSEVLSGDEADEDMVVVDDDLENEPPRGRELNRG